MDDCERVFHLNALGEDVMSSVSLRDLAYSFVDSLKSNIGKYNFIVNVAESVSSYNLKGVVRERVYDCFKALRPLRNDSFTVNDDISVGDWIYFRREYMFRRRAVPSDLIIEFIKEKGDMIAPYVRSRIRADFVSLVELTKRLEYFYVAEVTEFFDPIKVHVVDLSAADKIRSYDVRGVRVENSSPFHVQIFCGGSRPDTDLNIRATVNCFAIMEMIDILFRVYDRLKEKVFSVFNRDLDIVKRMEMIASPYAVAEDFCLGSGR
ncbi:MAG: hypothetical protein QXY99_01705 [Thermoproteota archaeon]